MLGEPDKFMQFCYAIMAGLSGVVIGTTIGWNSPVTCLMMKHEACDSQMISLYMAGYFCLGTTLGGVVQGRLVAAVGYKLSAVVYDSAVLTGWLFLTQVECFPGRCQDEDCYPDATSSRVVWIGRLIQGFGTGGLGLLTPTYISHITNFSVRGRAQMFHQAFVCFGVLYSYTFSNVINYPMLIGVSMIWPFLHLFITLLFLLESPYHMYRQQRTVTSKTVKTILRKIKGTSYNVDSDYADLQEYMQITSHKNWVSCRCLIVGIGLVAFQQTCGVNPFIFHMDEVINEFRYIFMSESYDAKLIIIGICSVQVLLCLIAVELIEYLGRKFMLMASAVGMSLCLSALMAFNVIFSTCIVDPDQKTNITMVLIFLYACSYSVGWGPVVMLVYTEVVHCDKWFTSLIYGGGQFVMFLSVYTFFDPKALQMDHTNKTLWVYMASCNFSIPFVYFCVPETRALHLNRVQVLYNLYEKRGSDYKECVQETSVEK